MGNIVLLDDLTINKIAAGEVIERPASVVKEVVENSIDAGANNITIEIKNGGISYIRITDNGKGIAKDDMEIAFERHATSKIRSAEDIEKVTSMGFRGEALASISAIAKVELVSKTAESNIGNKIIVEGGKILSQSEVGCPKGTTITIQNLFYNTPVRYKFLKKDFTESGYIEDVVTRIALVNPDIAIKFVNSGKTIIQTSGNGNIKDVVYGIYGKEIAENIVNVDYKYEDMAIKGVIGNKNIARSNRANQLFFVNKRYVKDRTLTLSAEQAYKDTIPAGKFGFIILNIEMNPNQLDVNVHPAKLEVRFQDENKIFKLVYHAIKEALPKENVIGENKKMSGDKFGRRNYIEEYEVGRNPYTRSYEEKSYENKGIGGFFKSRMNKNEFGTNDHNLVEELYNDKMRNENHNQVRETAEGNESSEGFDYKFNSISADNYSSSSNKNFSTINKNENYDNIIIKPDGGIEIKNYTKKEESSNNEKSNNTVSENTIKYNFKDYKTEKTNSSNTLISDETKVFTTPIGQSNNKKSSESGDTLMNFNWTDSKIEALKEQINALTNGNILTPNESLTNNQDKKEVEKLISNFKGNTTVNSDINTTESNELDNENTSINNSDTNSDLEKNNKEDIAEKENNVEDNNDVKNNNTSEKNNVVAHKKLEFKSNFDDEFDEEFDDEFDDDLKTKEEIAEVVNELGKKDTNKRLNDIFEKTQNTELSNKKDNNENNKSGIDEFNNNITNTTEIVDEKESLKEELDKYRKMEKEIDDKEKSNLFDSENKEINQEKANSKDSNQEDVNSKDSDASFEEMYEKMFGKPVIKAKEETKVEEEDTNGGYRITEDDFKSVENISLFRDQGAFSMPVYKFIGLVFDSNIIIEYENEMYIINQGVANERIMYEKVKDNYYNDSQKDSQLMLLPDIIELNNKQMGIAKDNINLFKKAGFDLEEFGENTIKLVGVPSICMNLDTRQLFIDTLEEVNTVARTAKKEIEEKFIETIACKSAERLPLAATENEIKDLLNRLLVLPNPFTCPGGKQCAIKMSKFDIERKFSRR